MANHISMIVQVQKERIVLLFYIMIILDYLFKTTHDRCIKTTRLFC